MRCNVPVACCCIVVIATKSSRTLIAVCCDITIEAICDFECFAFSRISKMRRTMQDRTGYSVKVPCTVLCSTVSLFQYYLPVIHLQAPLLYFFPFFVQLIFFSKEFMCKVPTLTLTTILPPGVNQLDCRINPFKFLSSPLSKSIR